MENKLRIIHCELGTCVGALGDLAVVCKMLGLQNGNFCWTEYEAAIRAIGERIEDCCGDLNAQISEVANLLGGQKL